MSVREYIGARYVPVFADPIQWDPTLIYEPLTVVTDQGASYVSRRMVPEGIQLDNTEYWVLWADFNAQLQHYIDEVDTFDGRIDALEDALPIADFSSVNTVSGKFPVVTADIADDAVTAAKIDDDAVETAAIADTAVTYAKLSSGVQSILDKNNLTKMLIIGDSYSSHSSNLQFTATWPAKVADSLGMTLTNLSAPGDGFVYNNGFLTQLATAEALPDKEKYGIIIVYGGVNDVNAGADLSTFRTNARTLINSLNENFVNAKIYLCGLNPGIGNFDSVSDMLDIESYLEVLRNLPIGYERCTFVNTTNWLLCGSDMYAADNLHPHDTNGNLALAYSFINLVHGVDDPFFTILDCENPTVSDPNETALQALFDKPYKVQNGVAYIPSSIKEITLTNPSTTGTFKTFPGIPSNVIGLRDVISGLAFQTTGTNRSHIYPVMFSMNAGNTLAAFPVGMPTTSETYRIFVPSCELFVSAF